MVLSIYQMKTFPLPVAWISESQHLPIKCALFHSCKHFCHADLVLVIHPNIFVLVKPPISGIPRCLSIELQLSIYIRSSKAFEKLGTLNHFFLHLIWFGKSSQCRMRCSKRGLCEATADVQILALGLVCLH